MKKSDTIAILMAVYNGGRYLKEQIDSIIGQSYSNWLLYIHDDGSTDDSLSIIQDYINMDRRIVLTEGGQKHLGPAMAFMDLLDKVESNLYMFCDQDDVWLKDKIQISFDRYCSLERENIPIVIHTDVSVVDENLNILAKSYWKDINLNPDFINTYNYLCVGSYTNGNTMLFNKKAKELCFPLLNNIIMHDLYVSSRVLKNGGVVEAIHNPLVLYRQHNLNVCGFKVGARNSIKNRLKDIKNVIRDNLKAYNSLKDYSFGSLFKYLKYKYLLEWHMHFEKHY